VRSLHPAIRDEVYSIGREALINAVRHAKASSIEVELEYRATTLLMVVRDNGRGIDPDVLRSGKDGHWGLLGMRERAESIGAKLRLSSLLGTGTEVELMVPGKIAYERSFRTTWRSWLIDAFPGSLGTHKRKKQVNLKGGERNG
jgi:signal transduction histidine kinase